MKKEKLGYEQRKIRPRIKKSWATNKEEYEEIKRVEKKLITRHFLLTNLLRHQL